MAGPTNPTKEAVDWPELVRLATNVLSESMESGRYDAAYLRDGIGTHEADFVSALSPSTLLAIAAERQGYEARIAELERALSGMIGGACPNCKGWGEIAYFGELVDCRCHGKYHHKPSDAAIDIARAALASTGEGA